MLVGGARGPQLPSACDGDLGSEKDSSTLMKPCRWDDRWHWSDRPLANIKQNLPRPPMAAEEARK